MRPGSCDYVIPLTVTTSMSRLPSWLPRAALAAAAAAAAALLPGARAFSQGNLLVLRVGALDGSSLDEASPSSEDFLREEGTPQRCRHPRATAPRQRRLRARARTRVRLAAHARVATARTHAPRGARRNHVFARNPLPPPPASPF